MNARVCDLVVAGQAYPSISPALTALDRITKLGKLGTLRFGLDWSTSALNKVPAEVWLLIRHSLIDGAVSSVRREMQEQFHCTACERAAITKKAEQLVQEGHLNKTSSHLTLHLTVESRDSRAAHQAAKVWSAEWIDHTSTGGHSHVDREAEHTWIIHQVPEQLHDRVSWPVMEWY